MCHDPCNRLGGHKELQVGCNWLHHKGCYHVGDIYLRAEEAARQAIIDVMAACSDVARMVNSSMALNAIDSRGVVVE